MEFKYLKIERKEDITFIEINRSEALNALNEDVLGELNDCFENLEKEKSNRVAVITGQGKAFVAGADIAKMRDFDPTKAYEFSNLGQSVFNKIDRSHIITIAAINGFALGGGCELAMACHLRIAGEKARFGQPEVNLGLIPGYGGTQRLIQYIGKTKATELMMTADMISATDALQLGLVNYVVPVGDEVAKAKELLNKIATKAPGAIAKIIKTVNAYFAAETDGFASEVSAFGECCATEDFREGAAAFVEKRAANFKGK